MRREQFQEAFICSNHNMPISSADFMVKPRWSIIAPGDHAAIAVQDKPVENVSCTRA
jgi:hypothetical protein